MTTEDPEGIGCSRGVCNELCVGVRRTAFERRTTGGNHPTPIPFVGAHSASKTHPARHRSLRVDDPPIGEGGPFRGVGVRVDDVALGVQPTDLLVLCLGEREDELDVATVG